MTSSRKGHEAPVKGELKLEKNAGLIMGTNNSSIVSKRSVERLYLPEPHFYRYFVRKPQRRSPTINRGYWLRMRAISYTVRQFLETPSEQPKVVLNLGCGYDPLPFQWLATEPQLCNNVKFVDVDYEELIISKRDIILATPKMNELLNLQTLLPDEKNILLDSKEYAAIGCDLRNLSRLDNLLNTISSIKQCLVLCVAEVSITYMAPDAADALIAWSASLSADVTFCLVEQRSPDRPDHPFTATMIHHFEKLGTPLRSLLKYPDCHSQTARFFTAGYHSVDSQNLWEFWTSPKYMSPSQRLALDQVEPFDEWEEFALFASHYCLVTAHNRQKETPTELDTGRRTRRDSCASLSSDISTRTVSPLRHGTQWFAYRYCENPDGEGRTHHASAYPVPNSDAIAIHGGIGTQARLGTTSVYRPSHLDMTYPSVPPMGKITARACHTITALGNGQNILIGGRGAPTTPMKDCWLQTGSSWERVHDLPEPRYRHRTVPILLPGSDFGVIVYGGKIDASSVASEVLLWSARNGWQVIRSIKHDPVPTFGATFVNLGNNHGLLFGGMRQDGVLCQGFWRWRLVIRDDGSIGGIAFRLSKALDASVGTRPWLSRLGASYSLIRNELLVIGGVAKLGTIPKIYEILSISGSLSALGEHEQEMNLRLGCVEPLTARPDQPRPFLVGHSTHRTWTDQTLFMGGGATCFSFGSFWNKGVWLLHDREAGLSSDWSLMKPARNDAKPPQSNSSRVIDRFASGNAAPLTVEVTSLKDPDILESVFHASIPKMVEDLDLGPCVALWTSTYLKARIPSDRTVIVHRSTSRSMNFQRKDFTYVSTPFPTFIDACLTGHHLYLRSLSSSAPTQTPARFDTDYPEIASDLRLPPELHAFLFDATRFHSSPLRISSNLNMWLHYDVMANVLFQIRGTKKLILFPPQDLKRLDFPPGATTSRLEVFVHTEQDDSGIHIPAETHPTIAVLKPGHAVFIPPLWAHTGAPVHSSTGSKPPQNSGDSPTDSTPDSNLNISINVFFRSFSSRHYAAGRDVYGNRDLAAYEDGRRDVDRIVRRFTRDNNAVEDLVIPKEITKAYLERLAGELMERAEEL